MAIPSDCVGSFRDFLRSTREIMADTTNPYGTQALLFQMLLFIHKEGYKCYEPYKDRGRLTAVDWIERFVILEAKVLLKSSNLNIQQIADELNFPSQSFFGKYFKKLTGMSPKEFRNS